MPGENPEYYVIASSMVTIRFSPLPIADTLI